MFEQVAGVLFGATARLKSLNILELRELCSTFCSVARVAMFGDADMKRQQGFLAAIKATFGEQHVDTLKRFVCRGVDRPACLAERSDVRHFSFPFAGEKMLENDQHTRHGRVSGR